LSRAAALTVWNSIVETATLSVAMAKDRFVLGVGDFEAASAAAHVQKVVEALKAV
jgi:hypothetical protein